MIQIEKRQFLLSAAAFVVFEELIIEGIDHPCEITQKFRFLTEEQCLRSELDMIRSVLSDPERPGALEEEKRLIINLREFLRCTRSHKIRRFRTAELRGRSFYSFPDHRFSGKVVIGEAVSDMPLAGA